MANIKLVDFYLGDKYNVMGKVVKEFVLQGSPDADERTGLELLIVKHTLLAAKELEKNGDCISEIEADM